MKNKIKINWKKIPVLVLSSFILLNSTGCGQQAEVNTQMEQKNDVDKKVQDYLNDFNDKISEVLESKQIEDAKETLADGFITIVDFFCYEGEIKGYTLNEMTEEGKKKAEEIWNTIDEKINASFPNYKEYVHEKYEKAKDWSIEKIDGILDFGSDVKDKIFDKIEEEIGSEKYNQIGQLYNEAKNQTKEDWEDVKELGEKGKEKIKSLYDNFKANH